MKWIKYIKFRRDDADGSLGRAILRNIAIVSAVFILTFSIMLITNYFQVRNINPLQTEVIETLKQINDENADNVELQEQIRQLDLLARKAYFIRRDHLMAGVYILIAVLAVFIVTLRFYYAEDKTLPGKQVAPVDEWMIKTHARKYIRWAAGGLVVAALAFAFLSSPYMSMSGGKPVVTKTAAVDNIVDAAEEQLSGTEENYDSEYSQAVPKEENPETETDESTDSARHAPAATASPTSASAETALTETATPSTAQAETASTETATAEKTEQSKQPDIPKVTHNGFRGNNSNAVSSAKGIPVSWNLDTGENIAWQSEVPKPGYNSPVVNGNRVFITGADEQTRELYCFDLFTGEKLWTLEANDIPGSPAQMPKTTEDTGLAASTVATNGKHVCAIFASGDLICADMDGKPVWAKNLGVPQNHYGYASSLLVFGNLLIVQYDNSNTPRIIALDLATGTERWNTSRQEKITWSSPIIAYVNNTPQLVLMGNPAITAYNPNSGEQYWRVEGLNGEVASSPCSAAGTVFGASEYAALIAVDASTGKTLWTANDYLPEVSSPAATKDNVYLATSYGVLACYDAKTGELKHARELNTEFYSSPVIVEGKLYIFSNDGVLYIYSANSDFKLLNSFETGQKTFATPAFTDGRIIVRTENSLYCVTEKG
ncbi:MAG: PQQ-binding-like beta-propeller repeat protein [Prevotellaceae bacterium]|nr:PQQ-binding-like beta-propeller repeat protein [Prevotellaceae bacterium]